MFSCQGQRFSAEWEPPRSPCSARPSLIRVLCVEVKKLSNFVRIKRSDNSTKKKKKEALIPNLAGVSQLTQSKCCRLEGRISLCKVTAPISTDRVTLVGGPAIISPFITLTDNQERQHMVPLFLLLIFLSADSQDSLTAEWSDCAEYFVLSLNSPVQSCGEWVQHNEVREPQQNTLPADSSVLTARPRPPDTRRAARSSQLNAPRPERSVLLQRSHYSTCSHWGDFLQTVAVTAKPTNRCDENDASYLTAARYYNRTRSALTKHASLPVQRKHLRAKLYT